MKGIDRITARILAEAEAEAARIAQEAQSRCETIRAEGELRAQERYWQRVKEGVKAAEERGQRLAKAADMEARKSILRHKQELVAETFRRAEERLDCLSSAARLDFLAALAVGASVSGREEILLGKRDQSMGPQVLARANAMLAERGGTAALTLADRAGEFASGLMLAEGNISVNCTLEALLAQARETMAAEVAAELFA